MAQIKNNPQESFKFMNNAAAYLALIDLSKRYDGVTAGLAFEKYLAVLLNAPVVGGSNGAADNIAKTVSGEIVYMSAKSYQDSVSTVGQSVTGKQGLANLIGPGLSGDGSLGASDTNKGKSVYYISLAKKRVGNFADRQVDMQYNLIDLYLARVFYNFEKKQFEGKGFYAEYLLAEGNGDNITSAGVQKLETVTSKSKKKKSITSSVKLYPDTRSVRPTYTLAAPTGDAAAFELTQKLLEDQTKNITNVVITAVKEAYVNSQKIEDGVRGYTAKKSTGSEAVTFVDQLKESYKLLFKNLSDMFDQGSSIAASPEEKGKVSDFKKGVTESRQLTDVIKEMKEKELKKR